MNSITVLGRRWFDKVNGNTYHSVRVLIDGIEKYNLPYDYGYGSMFEQNAENWLKKEGIINTEKYEGIFEYCKKNNINYYVDVVDVARKKDL